jgi:phosphoribosyl-ATP pyrophosphohydrolase
MARSKKKRSPKNAVPNQITELENAIAEVRGSRKISPRTARLVSSRLPRMAQKVAEEATEIVIEAVRGRRAAVIGESVDLIYNLAVLWSELGIAASEVWAEMDRRQALLGMAGKLPKDAAGSLPSVIEEVASPQSDNDSHGPAIDDEDHEKRAEPGDQS